MKGGREFLGGEKKKKLALSREGNKVSSIRKGRGRRKRIFSFPRERKNTNPPQVGGDGGEVIEGSWKKGV